MKFLALAMVVLGLLLGCKISLPTDSQAKIDLGNPSDEETTDRVSMFHFKTEYTHKVGEKKLRIRLIMRYKFVNGTLVEIQAKNVASKGSAEVIKMSPSGKQDTYQGKDKDGNVFTYEDGGELIVSSLAIRTKNGTLLEGTGKPDIYFSEEIWKKYVATEVEKINDEKTTDHEQQALGNLCKFEDGKKSLTANPTLNDTFHFNSPAAKTKGCHFRVSFAPHSRTKIQQCWQDCSATAEEGIRFKITYSTRYKRPSIATYKIGCDDKLLDEVKIAYEQGGLKMTKNYTDGLTDIVYTYDCPSIELY